jgi:uncharacterized protein (DUF58 family)
MVVLLMLLGAGLVYWIVGMLYARNWNKGLSVDIRFAVDHVIKGESTELIEEVKNQKYLPLPYIYIKFKVDKSLYFVNEDGNSAVSDYSYRNDVFSLMNYQRAVRKIPISCNKRGVYGINRIDMVSTGAFMNDILAMTVEKNAFITVYPEAVSADRLEIPFRQIIGNVERNRYLYEDKFVFRGIRDYESYDSFSQVNWKASARSGSLMVNQYNETTSQEVCILLNMESNGMIRSEALSEESISLAAGLVQMFVEQGIQTSLITNGRDCETKENVVIHGGSGLAHLNVVNTALARLDYNGELDSFSQLLDIYESEAEENEAGRMTDKMYLMISENTRQNLQESYRRLDRNMGVWIVPYHTGEERNFDMEGISVIEWEVKKHER